jgi:type IV pilus assembly protein PilC
MGLREKLQYSKNLSALDQFQFAQQLLSLLQVGLPLVNALELIMTSSPKTWWPWLSQLRDLLKKGNSFSHSLRAQKNRFSAEFINLIQVSERSGDLTLALKTICLQLESQIELRRTVQQSLTYPLITLLTSLLLIIVMMVWVIPVFKEVFDQFQAELPTPTRILILISSTVERFFLEILLGLVTCCSCFLFWWLRSISLQKRCDHLSLQIPIVGTLLRIATLTHWCRTLGHLLHSGLALPDALRITAQSSNHWLSHDISAEIFKQLARGWPFGEALSKADPHQILFDQETVQLLRISSESGSLAEMLCKRANILGARLSKQLSNLSHTLEPILILFVGMVIGSIVIILYLPIFNLGHII